MNLFKTWVVTTHVSHKPHDRLSTTKTEKDRYNLGNYQKKSSWHTIKLWLYFKLCYSERLIKEYFEAKIKQEQNIAKKIEAQTNILKIKEAKEFNNIINEIFSNNDIPDIAKAFKIAKILESNPKLLEEFQKVQEIFEQKKPVFEC